MAYDGTAMTAILVIIHLTTGLIHQRPMRDMEVCEDFARTYNENINVVLGKYKVHHYCAWVGSGWNKPR